MVRPGEVRCGRYLGVSEKFVMLDGPACGPLSSTPSDQQHKCCRASPPPRPAREHGEPGRPGPRALVAGVEGTESHGGTRDIIEESYQLERTGHRPRPNTKGPSLTVRPSPFGPTPARRPRSARERVTAH